SLERIKAKGTYELMDRMLDLFAERQVPADEDERIEVFDHIQSEHADEIAELDDRFYDVGENLVALTLSFVQKNLKDFRCRGCCCLPQTIVTLPATGPVGLLCCLAGDFTCIPPMLPLQKYTQPITIKEGPFS